MDGADRATLHRIVLQHAESARLMGVDFVPVYRSGGAGAAITEAPEPETEPAALDIVIPARAPAAAGCRGRIGCPNPRA
jgi:hypothetical protein